MSSTKKADHDGDSVVSFYETEDELKAQKEKKGGCVGCLRDNLFVIFILLGVVVGFGIGFGVRELKPSAEAIVWIAMPGNIFIRLLELTILPLIASNLIVVISHLDPKEQGLGSVLTVAYILGFNFAAAAIGTAMAALIKPGVGVNMTTSSTEIQDPGLTLTTSDVFSDLLLIVSLPEMFEGCDQWGVDQSISRFSCPLMTALKADGPAVFISSAAVFVAQTETELPSAGTLVVICYRDTFEFIEDVGDLDLNGVVMFSVDVFSLFTNVSVTETVEHICEFQSTNHREIADVFMGKLEKCQLNDQINNLKYYGRYVDDIFAIATRETSITAPLDTVNQAHPSIRFTLEVEGQVPCLFQAYF
ncbi:hypothetical protein SprV_0100311200 [Sparganum proliferum]